MKKKGSIEKRLIRSMSQAVEIAEGTTAPSREYDLPLMTAKRVSVPPAPEYDAKSVIAIQTHCGVTRWKCDVPRSDVRQVYLIAARARVHAAVQRS